MTRLGLALGAVAGVIAATQPISDTDMWWHLATGRETLAQGLVRTDLFSWTVRGTPVTTDQWLGQVTLYLSYLAMGWRGVALLRVALVALLVSCVALAAARTTSRPLAIVLATMPALILTRVVWVDRPELFGYALFAILLLLLRIGRDGSRAALAGAVAVTALWTNIHGSFALGVVVTLCACAEGALRDHARRPDYLLSAAGSLVATLLDPAGLGAWTAPGAHFLSPPRAIQEWNVIDVRTPLGIAYATTLALVLASVFLGRRLAPRELALLLPIAFLSLTAARQAPLLAIAAAPLFAMRAAAILERTRSTEGTRGVRVPNATQRWGARRREGFGRAGALALTAAVVAIAVAAAPAAPDEAAYPIGVLTSIPHGDGTLARYEWGGWLIWSGVPVFVDGRLTPYAGGVIDDYRRIVAAAPGWRELLARRGVRTLVVVPTDPVALRALDLGWSVLARSNSAIVIAVP